MSNCKFFVLLLLVAFLACDDYDSFTTDRSATLQFSQDTVRFDTLLSTVPSATKTLVVYNHGDKGLRIRSIGLERGAASPFRVNVDGQDLSRTERNLAADFEVRRRDSIIVRIEVTLPVNASDSVFELTDRLLFSLESGIEQSAALVASSQNAEFHRGWVITADTTLTASHPIVVYDSLVVAAGAEYALPDGGDLSLEDIINLNPDVIIVDYMDDENLTPEESKAQAIASIMDEAALAEVTAVANGKVMAINLTDVYGGGIRMVPSVETMFNFMYGD